VEEEWEPFEVIQEEGETTLRLCGIKEERKTIEETDVPKILRAIKRGWNVDIDFAVVEGDINIAGLGLDRDEQGRSIIASEILIMHSIINGTVDFNEASFRQVAGFSNVSFEQWVDFIGASFESAAVFNEASFEQRVEFSNASFEKEAYFGNTSFEKEAYFDNASFEQKAEFSEASFEQRAEFSEASFEQRAEFLGVKMTYPAYFIGVHLRENTVLRGLWNYILAPLFWPIVLLIAIVKAKRNPEREQKLWEVIKEKSRKLMHERVKATVTDVSSINTNTIIDTSTNPRLKRYIDDEQWIYSWRSNPKGRWWREAVFRLWELTSHCGRSIGLWAFWSFLLVSLFTLSYTPAPNWMGNSWCNFWQEHGAEFEQTAPSLQGQPVGFWSCFYFSIVSFTTLGFGDIVAINPIARFLVGAEVVLGYVMLGGLISIFANKFARRS